MNNRQETHYILTLVPEDTKNECNISYKSF